MVEKISRLQPVFLIVSNPRLLRWAGYPRKRKVHSIADCLVADRLVADRSVADRSVADRLQMHW